MACRTGNVKTMRVLLGMVFFTVSLSAPFGLAEATAVEVSDEGMVIEVIVEVEETALVVLARGASQFDELPPVALAELSPGRWGGIVEIPVVEDILLGFELIRPDGGSAIVSELHRLSELGVDAAVFASAEPAPPTTSSDGAVAAPVGNGEPSRGPIWLAVAAGAAILRVHNVTMAARVAAMADAIVRAD